jgi:hypothetical protein
VLSVNKGKVREVKEFKVKVKSNPMKSLAAATTYSSWLMTVLLSILLLKKQQRSTEEEQEQELAPLLSPDPFPWEPNRSTTSSTDDTDDTSNTTSPNAITKHHPIITISNANEEQQLHFLSQMTFANGGLRSPSCPCCQ